MRGDPPDLMDRVRAFHVPARPVNDQFRSYVQSTAFSLSLGRTHITALVHLEHALHRDLPQGRWPISETALAALHRRGLILAKSDAKSDDQVSESLWSQGYTITTAGRLVLQLLDEAGLIPSAENRTLPPPPPGWTDPRPVLDLGGPA
jgi:hypothetical protein